MIPEGQGKFAVLGGIVGFVLVIAGASLGFSDELLLLVIVAGVALVIAVETLRRRRRTHPLEYTVREEFPVQPDTLFSACEKAAACIPELSDVVVQHPERTIQARVAPTWRSTGELLVVSVVPSRSGQSELEVLSTSTNPNTVAEFGQNKRSCEGFVALVKTFLAQYGRIAP